MFPKKNAPASKAYAPYREKLVDIHYEWGKINLEVVFLITTDKKRP